MPLPLKDYYTILGLPPVATLAEIRRAWRTLAMRWHPDKNPGDPEAPGRFEEIKEAFEVLTNPVRKQQYLEERWLAGYQARNYDRSGPPTPQNILKQVLQYEQQIFSHDLFRMNKYTAAAGAEALLDDARIELLLREDCGDIRVQVLYALLRITERLPAGICGPLFIRIGRLVAGDAELERQVTQVRKQQLWLYRWQRYNWILALVAALLLTLLLWRVAGGG